MEEAGTALFLRFGVFEMDLKTGELRKLGKLIHLAPQPFRLLALLAGKTGELVTREEIQRELWADDTIVDFEQGLSFAVKKARAALGDDSHSPRYIETLPRRGYRFLAPVAKVDSLNGTSATVADTLETDEIRTRPRWRRKWVIGAGTTAIAATLIALSAGPLRNRIFEKPRVQINSIAVLPFENIPQDPAREYFADGMTDELITELSQISALHVTARTSSMAYRGSGKPLREIGRELGVDAVVEGTVEQTGGRVRVNAELVNVSTERNFWAASYERDSKDVLSLQSDVAEAIAKQIQVKVAPQEKQRLQAVQAVNPSAYDAYLRGTYLLDQRSNAEAHLTTQYFREAIRLQPDYARAYAGLSMSLVSQTFLGQARPTDVMSEARATARQALQLDPNLGEAYTALGSIELTYDWRWKAAGQDLQRGIQLNPNDPFGRIMYAVYWAAVGRQQEAVAEAQKAVTVDPISFFANRNLASMLYFSRQYDAALAQLQRTRELRDEPDVIDNWVSWIDLEKHLDQGAVRHDLRALAADAPAAVIDSCRAAYDSGGSRAYWEETIKIMLPRADGQCVPYFLGVRYARLGDMDDAFLWLNRAVDQHCISIVWLAVDPQLDAIRSDLRFKALLRRIKLAS